MRWPWRKPQVVHRFKVTTVGESVHLVIEHAYEDIEQPISAFEVVLAPAMASKLHRDLSVAAERARTYPERARAERVARSMDAVFDMVMSFDKKATR